MITWKPSATSFLRLWCPLYSASKGTPLASTSSLTPKETAQALQAPATLSFTRSKALCSRWSGSESSAIHLVPAPVKTTVTSSPASLNS